MSDTKLDEAKSLTRSQREDTKMKMRQQMIATILQEGE